ncbi:hypothetical protein [Pedobacter sp. Leaf132]|uniref:hypothetical protein n=1 Tax=Pedobacter sp. Leaf132 TaxID=2876557 RepID=UPI001E54A794|nr:hypothetical protein [Pedobacter sp. Leaf132]
MKDLFGNDVSFDAVNRKNKSGALKINPCVGAYGKGPEGTRCKTCTHLYCKSFGKRYYKCELRKDTNGPATDHKVNWPSCRKYEKNENK